MISEKDKELILRYARKYKIEKVILFGSSKDKIEARDIDLGVKGLSPSLFFDFFWELYRDLSKPVDIIDLSEDSLFNKIIEEEGIVIYG
jgi:predicted nucleotidyltransferase